MRDRYNWLYASHYSNSRDFKDLSRSGVSIKRPIDLSFLQNASHIKALSLEFSSSFKKLSVNFSDYLEQLLRTLNLEYLTIRYSDSKALEISSSILDHKLKFLEISTNKFIDISFIGQMKQLESLAIMNRDHIILPESITDCTALRAIRLSSTACNIAPIYIIDKLEELEISNIDIDSLKTFKSNSISKLRIRCPKLKRLSTDNQFPKLEELHISTREELEVPINYFPSSLSNLNLSGSKLSPIFPTVFEKTERIVLNCKHIPRINAAILDSLYINYTEQNAIDEILGNLPNLNRIEVNSIENFNLYIDHEKCPNLKIFKIKDVSENNRCIDFSKHKRLKSISIGNGNNTIIELPENGVLSYLSVMGIGNETIDISQMKQLPIENNDPNQNSADYSYFRNNVQVTRCDKLKSIKLFDHLIKFEVRECQSLTEITLNQPAQSLDRFTINDCDHLTSIPAEVFLCNETSNISINNKNVSISTADFKSILGSIAELEEEKRLSVGQFILDPTQGITNDSLKAFCIKSRPLFKALINKIDSINKDKNLLESVSIESLKDKIICFAGKPHEKKTSLKSYASELGMTTSTKAKNADIVVLGYSSDIDYSADQIYMSEIQFEKIRKKLAPGFLQKSATKGHIEKLRQILWSKDPKSENMALEMLKKGGLLEEVTAEAVVTSKYSIDPSIKRKYKSFLKGKVDNDWKAVISSRHTSTTPLSNRIKGDYFRAMYMKGEYGPESFLRYNIEDRTLRMQAINEYLIPKVLEKPHYLRLGMLHSSELELILNLEPVKSQLKRISVSLIGEIPTQLGEIITIKELLIRVSGYKEIPQSILSLTRLNKLDFSSNELEFISDDILNLKQLKSLHLHFGKQLSVPEKILSLPKLKHHGLSNNKRVIFRP